MEWKQPKGIYSVRKTLADGTVKRYFYAWKGGPRVNALWGTSLFLAEYARLIAQGSQNRTDDARCLSSIVSMYRQSPAFKGLATSTRRSYEACLMAIDAEFGSAPIHLFEEKGARREMLEWRDRLAERGARTADMHIAVFKRVLSWAVDREIIDINKLARAGRLHNGTRRDRIWSEEECQQFLTTATPCMATSFMLALNTGQRQGDLLRMTWNAYNGSTLSLKQSKSGTSVRLRVSLPLKEMLDAMPRTTETILSNSKSKSWTSNGFRASWAKAMVRAGLAKSGLTFHDLRGTFITRAYKLGYSINEIAEASGHSQRDAEAIIRRHYLAAKDMTR